MTDELRSKAVKEVQLPLVERPISDFVVPGSFRMHVGGKEYAEEELRKEFKMDDDDQKPAGFVEEDKEPLNMMLRKARERLAADEEEMFAEFEHPDIAVPRHEVWLMALALFAGVLFGGWLFATFPLIAGLACLFGICLCIAKGIRNG